MATMGDDADASVSPMLRAGEEEAVFSEDEEVPDTPQRPPAVAAGGAGGAGRRKRKLEAKARFGTGPLADTPDGHPLNGGKKARTRARAEAAGGERQPWEWSRRRLTWGSLRYVTRWYRTARIAQAVMVPGGGVPRGVPTITKKHASELRKLLGAENTASLERLERRAGIKPPKMPDRKFVSPHNQK